MDMDKLREEITFDEGRRRNPYKDSVGIYTGGVGHNLQAHGATWQDICGWMHAGIPDVVIDQWLVDDIADAVKCCREIFQSFDDLSDDRQRVLINMAFDLMYELRDWHGLKAAVSEEEWSVAAQCILASRFAQQAPARCQRLAARMVEG